jgi:hypothetical protein
MQNGLGANETLARLELKLVRMCDDSIDLWGRALSFLRTNKTLKSFVVYVQYSVMESSISAFHIAIAAMLEENASLESLSIQNSNTLKFKAEEYLVFVTALQHNKTLKTLSLYPDYSAGRLTDDEDKNGSSVSKGIEVLSAIRSDINCVFLHPLENPRLCDRSALESASDSIEERRGSANPANHNGKREEVQALKEGK